MPLRSTKQPEESSVDKPQVTHLLNLARDVSKQIESRAILLAIPLLVSTIAITGAAKPHFQRIDGTFRRLQTQQAAADKLRNEEKHAEGLKLTVEQLKLLRQREESSAEANRISNAVVHAIKQARVEVAIPGSEKIKIPLFYASNIIQLVILVTLIYIWMLRRRALQLIDEAARLCSPIQLKANRLLATPASPLLQPLPRREWSGHALLDSQSQGNQARLPIIGLLLVLCALSAWLTYLSSKTSDIIIRGNAADHLPLVISCGLTSVIVGLSLAWLLFFPSQFASNRIDFRTRRSVAFTALAIAFGAALTIKSKPKMVNTIWQNMRQSIFAKIVHKPRFKLKKRNQLKTALIRDGFLFNPNTTKAHVVVGGRVISVKSSNRQEKSFAGFLPIGIMLSASKNKSIRQFSRARPLPRGASATANTHNIANNHTQIAIERYVLFLIQVDPVQAKDFLRDAILSRLPNWAPSRTSHLDLRLFDLYAKLATMSYDSKGLDEFVSAIKAAKIGHLVSDRIDRWLDPKSKWRKRVLDFGRCSKVGYPVVGRCEFESRPTGPYRRSRQWFEPSSSLGGA